METRETSAADVCSSIVWMAHLIDRFTNTRLAAGDYPTGMSFARANLLFAVQSARQNDTSSRMVDIALDLGVTARTLTTMVDALERQGLIVRVADPTDRRAIQLDMTSEGTSILPALTSHIHSASETVLGPLSQSERTTLVRLMNKLIERG